MPLTIDEAEYGRLLAEHRPSVIETDDEQDRLSEALLRLTVPPRHLSPEEGRLAALLGHLVEDYERRATEGKIQEFAPTQRLAYLMEQSGLSADDLAVIFGTPGEATAAIEGRRPITVDQALALQQRFRVAASAFLY